MPLTERTCTNATYQSTFSTESCITNCWQCASHSKWLMMASLGIFPKERGSKNRRARWFRWMASRTSLNKFMRYFDDGGFSCSLHVVVVCQRVSCADGNLPNYDEGPWEMIACQTELDRNSVRGFSLPLQNSFIVLPLEYSWVFPNWAARHGIRRWFPDTATSCTILCPQCMRLEPSCW